MAKQPPDLDMWIQDLVTRGCVAAVGAGGAVYPVAEASVDEYDKTIWWVAMFPEDQHHTHLHRYTRAELDHDRYLSIWLPNQGARALYFGPYEEWPDLAEDFRDTKGRWDAWLRDPINAGEYRHWVDGVKESAMAT